MAAADTQPQTRPRPPDASLLRAPPGLPPLVCQVVPSLPHSLVASPRPSQAKPPSHTHFLTPKCVYPAGVKELTPEDVTPNAPSLVVYSRKGYIKRMSADTFTVQGRAGRGRVAAAQISKRSSTRL